MIKNIAFLACQAEILDEEKNSPQINFGFI